MELGRPDQAKPTSASAPICRRRSSAASYRVIDNDRKFRSTDSGGALTILAALNARARGARRFQALCRPTCSSRLGGAAATGRPMVRPAALSPLLF